MKKIILSLLLLSILILSACTNSTTVDDSKLNVVTTSYPIYFFANEIAGDVGNVELLLPYGTDPHSFDPSPKDMIKIINSDAFIFTSEYLEMWVHDIEESLESENVNIYDAGSVVEYIDGNHDDHDHIGEHDEDEEHVEDEDHADTENGTSEEHEEHGEFDPHYWLSLENNLKVIDYILTLYVQLDPENEIVYIENAQSLKSDIELLKTKYETTLSNCENNFVISGGHNIYGYLEHEYHFEVETAAGLSPDSEPTPEKIKKLNDLAIEHNTKYVLFEELVNPNLAKSISNDVGAEVLSFNPGATILKDDFDAGMNFISIMEENLNTLSSALNCK